MDIITHRRNLHQIPELDRQLPKTLAYLRAQLEKLPCRVISPAEGSLAAFFDFGQEKTVAFRGDVDALPLQERTGAPYASQHPGAMHACGHDGHAAILLELAARLQGGSNNVLLVFQCAEETTGGAQAICDSGLLEAYNVRAIFGLHLWPSLEKGALFTTAGPMMASSQEVHVRIQGKSAHVAKADQGLDALQAGVVFYQNIQAFLDSFQEKEPYLLKFGTFHAGTACNALAASAALTGTVRTFSSGVKDRLLEALYSAAQAGEKATNCNISLEFSQGYPPISNNFELLRRVFAAAPLQPLPFPSMTTDDFAVYQRYVPGIYFFLGLGDTPPLHSDTFDFDEKILEKGADFFEKLAKLEL